MRDIGEAEGGHFSVVQQLLAVFAFWALLFPLT
jgi:hypothetical protein